MTRQTRLYSTSPAFRLHRKRIPAKSSTLSGRHENSLCSLQLPPRSGNDSGSVADGSAARSIKPPPPLSVEFRQPVPPPLSSPAPQPLPEVLSVGIESCSVGEHLRPSVRLALPVRRRRRPRTPPSTAWRGYFPPPARPAPNRQRSQRRPASEHGATGQLLS